MSFVLAKNTRGLGHEAHAAKKNDVRFGFSRFLGKAQGIAHKIRDVLNVSHLIIMGEDHGIAHLFQRPDLILNGVV